jgi:hypothetical protein
VRFPRENSRFLRQTLRPFRPYYSFERAACCVPGGQGMMFSPSGLVACWSPTTAGDGFAPEPRPSHRSARGDARPKRSTRLAAGIRRGEREPPYPSSRRFVSASAASALDRVPTQGDKTSRSETARGKRPRVETGGRRPESPIASDARRRRRGGGLHRTTTHYVGGRGGV